MTADNSDLFSPLDTFPRRHIGPADADVAEMLKTIGAVFRRAGN